MPFVLRSGETWIKNNGSDFYLDFSAHVTNTKNTKVIVAIHFRFQMLNCTVCFDSCTGLLLIQLFNLFCIEGY